MSNIGPAAIRRRLEDIRREQRTTVTPQVTAMYPVPVPSHLRIYWTSAMDRVILLYAFERRIEVTDISDIAAHLDSELHIDSSHCYHHETAY